MAAATQPPPNPVASIRRFLSQPRLLLGWFIPFGRSCWWTMFAVYPPIYMVQTLGSEQGGLWGAGVVSVGNGLLFGAPLAGRLAARIGLRRPIIGAYVGMGLLTLAAGLLYAWPPAVIACLLAAACGAVTLDALGGIPFMRFVHPYERPQMTSVYRTYIDMSDLLSAAAFLGVAQPLRPAGRLHRERPVRAGNGAGRAPTAAQHVGRSLRFVNHIVRCLRS